MYNVEPTIIIGDTDRHRLLSLLDLHDTPASERLSTELHRAMIVQQREVPADVVAMNTDVVYEDCDTFTRRKVRVVYPQDADATRGRVSVLAPIGSALLGLRVGQTISWEVPHGTKRIRVVEVQYQPDARDDHELAKADDVPSTVATEGNKVKDRSREWDVVDQASFDSFPASDPPGYYTSIASTASTNPASSSAAPEQSRRDEMTPSARSEKH